MTLRRLVIPVLLPAALCGCIATSSPPPSAPISTGRTSIGAITSKSLSTDYAHERQYRTNPEAPLKLALALSGGGTKAGMFAHGVLHGLHTAGILEHVDAISTVSGGGYAALWYFTKLIEADRQGYDPASIFADCIPHYWTSPAQRGQDPRLDVAMLRAVSQGGAHPADPRARPVCVDYHHWQVQDPYRWQAHLVRWPDVFGTSPVSPTGSAQGRPERAIREGLFDGLLIEPILQMLTHRSTIPELYQGGIERTWGLNPDERTGLQAQDEQWTFSNARRTDPGDLNSPLRLDARAMSWPALRAIYEPARVASGGAMRTWSVPLWIVNANDGNKTADRWANAQHNFEITPFGAGSAQTGYVHETRLLPIADLGTSIRASAGFADSQGLTSWKRTVVNSLSTVWPGARWGVPVTVPTTDGTKKSIRLSDGGGSENLGLYALLQRGVEDIIVVDAAQDIEGDMSDVCDVRAALKRDGIYLTFKQLHKLDDVCSGTKRYNVSDWPSPVVEGEAIWPGGRVSRIWLIKAAWDQRAVADAYTDSTCGNPGKPDCFLTVFYGHNSTIGVHGKDEGGTNMAFPQLPTAGSTANASSYLFWGYRELGRSVTRDLTWNAAEARLELKAPRCVILALDRRSGDRPAVLRSRHSVAPCDERM